MDLNFLSALELRQICYFLTIVDNGNNFSRAAECLYVEQPPLSQRIRTLEFNWFPQRVGSVSSSPSHVVVLRFPFNWFPQRVKRYTITTVENNDIDSLS